MDADMGGTQIFEPLKSIFHNKPIKGHPRQVEFIKHRKVQLNSLWAIVQKAFK